MTDLDPGGARNWTLLGNLASAHTATVDQRGLVTPWPGGWSLDWWVGADDRWHFPSRETGVRQRLVDGTPVVETAMRVPGGDAVHRVYAVRASSASGLGELVVVEIHNQTAVPFALALAVRPYNLDGPAAVHEIGILGRTVTVNGRVALVLPAAPRLMAGGSAQTGDSAAVVVNGHAGDVQPEVGRCPAGMAQAAFLFPLAHTAILRVAMPIEHDRKLVPDEPGRHPQVHRPPTSNDAARAWQAQSKRGLRVELPPGRLADAVEANRRYLLLFQRGGAVDPGPQTTSLVAALDRYGFHAEAAELAARPVSRHDVDATAPALWAIAEHWRLTGDVGLVRQLVPAIAQAARRIERRRHRHLSFCDSLWSLAALLGSAALLAAAEKDAAAATVSRWAAGLRADVDTSFDASFERDEVLTRLGAVAAIGTLGGCPPAVTAATAEAVRDHFCVGDSVSPSGSAGMELSPLLTMQLAAAELDAGDRRALDRLQWVVDAASTTFTWPEVLDRRSGVGCRGDGHHRWTATEFCSLVRNLLVREVPDGLALLSQVPDNWLGRSIEVHGAPTHQGELSYAVRWHGDRPALLWELRRPAGAAKVRLTAPGLDAGWSSTEAVGDALLAPVAGPVGPAAVPSGQP